MGYRKSLGDRTNPVITWVAASIPILTIGRPGWDSKNKAHHVFAQLNHRHLTLMDGVAVEV